MNPSWALGYHHISNEGADHDSITLRLKKILGSSRKPLLECPRVACRSKTCLGKPKMFGRLNLLSTLEALISLPTLILSPAQSPPARMACCKCNCTCMCLSALVSAHMELCRGCLCVCVTSQGGNIRTFFRMYLVQGTKFLVPSTKYKYWIHLTKCHAPDTRRHASTSASTTTRSSCGCFHTFAVVLGVYGCNVLRQSIP